MGKQKRALLAKNGGPPSKKMRNLEKEERRLHRMQIRMDRKRAGKKKKFTGTWEGETPANLVAKLDAPKVKTKYQSYFEFAENTEKKKKLETQVCSCLL
jgi:hypothetical protein